MFEWQPGHAIDDEVNEQDGNENEIDLNAMYGEAPSPTHSSSDENEWDTGSHTWDEDKFYFGQSDAEDDFMNKDDEIFLPARQVDDSDTSLTEVLQRNETEEITNSNADIFVANMQERAEADIEESASVDAGNIENDGTANVEEAINNENVEETEEHNNVAHNVQHTPEHDANEEKYEQQDEHAPENTNIESTEQTISTPAEAVSEPRYNLRSNRKRNFSARLQFFAKQHRRHGVRAMMREIYRQTVNVMFTQMQARTGIKKHGQRAIAVMFKEYVQLKDLDVMEKVSYNSLTTEQKKRALRAINLIKEKRNGVLKGRTVADGRAQRAYVPREEATSPALGHETLIASAVVDAFERRDVGLFDVPGAYLHATFDKFVLLKFEDEFVDIMIQVNPTFASEVQYEGKRKYYTLS